MFVALEYLSSQAYAEVHQGSIPTPTYYFVQTIQRFREHGPSRGPLLAIRSWWLSSGAAVEEALHHLDHSLAFWHFQYHQWGGFMDMVSESLL